MSIVLDFFEAKVGGGGWLGSLEFGLKRRISSDKEKESR
jgi:hypothetical protein